MNVKGAMAETRPLALRTCVALSPGACVFILTVALMTIAPRTRTSLHASRLAAVGNPTTATAASPNPPNSDTDVPLTIPSNGVEITNRQVRLSQYTASAPLVSERQAFVIARGDDSDLGASPQAVLAFVTLESTVPPPGFPQNPNPVQDRPAWIIVTTFPPSTAMYQGAAPVHGGNSPDRAKLEPQSHFNIVLDADSGQILEGFFTP
jgi:hypothetical protein